MNLYKYGFHFWLIYLQWLSSLKPIVTLSISQHSFVHFDLACMAFPTNYQSNHRSFAENVARINSVTSPGKLLPMKLLTKKYETKHQEKHQLLNCIQVNILALSADQLVMQLKVQNTDCSNTSSLDLSSKYRLNIFQFLQKCLKYQLDIFFVRLDHLNPGQRAAALRLQASKPSNQATLKFTNN